MEWRYSKSNMFHTASEKELNAALSIIISMCYYTTSLVLSSWR
jgi:hypothetical protein